MQLEVLTNAEMAAVTLPATLFSVYRWLRPVLCAPSRRALRLISNAGRAAHDHEEPALHARTHGAFSSEYDISVSEMAAALGGILARGCRPDQFSLWLEPHDPQQHERS